MDRRLIQAFEKMTMPESCAQRIEARLQAEPRKTKQTVHPIKPARTRAWEVAAACACLALVAAAGSRVLHGELPGLSSGQKDPVASTTEAVEEWEKRVIDTEEPEALARAYADAWFTGDRETMEQYLNWENPRELEVYEGDYTKVAVQTVDPLYSMGQGLITVAVRFISLETPSSQHILNVTMQETEAGWGVRYARHSETDIFVEPEPDESRAEQMEVARAFVEAWFRGDEETMRSYMVRQSDYLYKYYKYEGDPEKAAIAMIGITKPIVEGETDQDLFVRYIALDSPNMQLTVKLKMKGNKVNVFSLSKDTLYQMEEDSQVPENGISSADAFAAKKVAMEFFTAWFDGNQKRADTEETMRSLSVELGFWEAFLVERDDYNQPMGLNINNKGHGQPELALLEDGAIEVRIAFTEQSWWEEPRQLVMKLIMQEEGYRVWSYQIEETVEE